MECLLPFPDDWYTRPDTDTDTGRRVDFAADVEARTIGARLLSPAPAACRSPDTVPYWGIRRIGSRQLPHRGSAMTVWDSGTPTPPLTNTRPADPSTGTTRTRIPATRPPHVSRRPPS